MEFIFRLEELGMMIRANVSFLHISSHCPSEACLTLVLTGNASSSGGEFPVWRPDQPKHMCYPSFSFVSRVAVVSKSFEGQTDKTEEWYGTQYKQEAISDATVKVISGE